MIFAFESEKRRGSFACGFITAMRRQLVPSFVRSELFFVRTIGAEERFLFMKKSVPPATGAHPLFAVRPEGKRGLSDAYETPAPLNLAIDFCGRSFYNLTNEC